MSNNHLPENQSVDGAVYQIRLQGHLTHNWEDWFGGIDVAPQENGETLLTASVMDQAALYGLLRQIRDLGLPLISVIRIQPDGTNSELSL